MGRQAEDTFESELLGLVRTAEKKISEDAELVSFTTWVTHYHGYGGGRRLKAIADRIIAAFDSELIGWRANVVSVPPGVSNTDETLVQYRLTVKR